MSDLYLLLLNPFQYAQWADMLNNQTKTTCSMNMVYTLHEHGLNKYY